MAGDRNWRRKAEPNSRDSLGEEDLEEPVYEIVDGLENQLSDLLEREYRTVNIKSPIRRSNTG